MLKHNSESKISEKNRRKTITNQHMIQKEKEEMMMMYKCF